VLAFPVRLRLSGDIEKSEQFNAATGLRLGAETDSEFDIDSIWREDDVLILAFKDRFPKLIPELLDGVGNFWFPCLGESSRAWSTEHK
jgi:hypothetical protein